MLFGGFLGQLILWVVILQLGVLDAATKGKKRKSKLKPKPKPTATQGSATAKQLSATTTFASTAKSSGIVTKSCPAKRGLGKRVCNIQEETPWHLEWISQKDLTKVSWVDIEKYEEEMLQYTFKWSHDPTWGSNVIIYVIDSGVLGTHDAFTTGQVEAGDHVSRLDGDQESNPQIDTADHGTPMASLMVGQRTGIALQGRIYPIKVDTIARETDETNDDVTEAITIAVKNWKPRVAKNPELRAVINISWAVRHSAKLQAAMESAIKASMHVVIAAGNSGANECYDEKNPPTKPYLKDVGQIVVSGTAPLLKGTKIVDGYHNVFNYGPCVDIFAPGHRMWGAYVKHLAVYGTHDGTSTSAAVVTGTVAAILSSNAQYRDLDPALFKEKFLSEFGVKGVHELPPNTPDRRLLIKKLVDSI